MANKEAHQVAQKDAGKGIHNQEMEFVSETSAAVLIETPRGGRVLLWAIFGFVATALTWASWAELDEVTRGSGKVIPSSQIQVVQNLEGGILSALFVSEGQQVEKGEVLLQIDDTRFSSSLRESKLQLVTLKAKAARLEAEVSGEIFSPTPELLELGASVVRDELELYRTRRQELDQAKSILDDERRQITQELAELRAKRSKLDRSYKLVAKELQISRPLKDAGAISEVEILRLERQVNELKGELEGAQLAIPRARSKLRAAEKKIEEANIQFANEARAELNTVNAELLQMKETNVALEDRVERTAVRSPVKGTVKQVMFNTVGGVIKPGDELVEIVPLDDTLLVEAEVSPKDIAFLYPGLKTIVKISAYDFAIYGGLEGRLEHISADTITSERDEESYYLVRIRTDKTSLGSESKPLPIIPGMLAEVDILTGKKTVLDYILKPILRARDRAMRER